MGRTQIYLTEAERQLLDRASRVTGASRSELIRRAVREVYGSGEATGEERLERMRAARGIWKDRRFTGEEYVRAIRSGDVDANLRRLGVE